MSDTVSLPGSGGVVVPVASANFANEVLAAIFQDDGGNSGNITYTSTSGKAGPSPTILIDSMPGTQVAGHGNVGMVDQDNSGKSDVLIGNSTTQFMIGNNPYGDTFDVNSDASVSGGSGNDTVNVADGDYATANLGAGDNVVNLGYGSGIDLEPSDTTGSDTVNALGQDGEDISVGGSGYDTTINLSGATALGDTIDGAGGQTVNVSGGGSTVEIGAQSDGTSDSVNVTGGSSTIDLDPGAVMVASGSFTVVNSNDTPSVMVGLSVTTPGGATVTGGDSGGVIFKGVGGDSVIAGSGSATLYGGSGMEYFSAGTDSASVVFHTGNGAETIVGGNGSDTISVVGSGKDTFDFYSTTSGGTHVIDNFSMANDTIDLQGYTAGSIMSETTTGSTQNTEVTTISLNDGTTLKIHGLFSNSDIKYT